MNNTRNLYTKAKEYQDKRKAIVDEYEGRLASLEQMKGSTYYEKEAKAAEEKRDAALSSLKAEYAPAFSAIMGEMLAAAGRREAQAPTAEELRIVQALKMRDFDFRKNNRNLNLVAEELGQIAQTVKNNAMCLSIVQEVAQKHGIHRDYMSMYTGKDMPAASVSEYIRYIDSGIREFMEYDTSTAARIARESHEKRYGKYDETMTREKTWLGLSSGYTPVPKRKLFDTQEEFYQTVFNLKGEAYEAFAASVND